MAIPINLTEVELQQLLSAATEQSFRSSGAGSFLSQYQTILSKHDRFGYNLILPNHEVVGLTFITRPKLNLSTTSVRQNRILSVLDTLNPISLQFAIRCLLDTKFASRTGGPNRHGKPTGIAIAELASKCPFFNHESPFIVPLSNCLVSISGWPDPVIDTETTEGGYYSEDQTFARGSDRLSRSYDLTLTFRDIQGGFVLALLFLWHTYIELVTRGDVLAYDEDIAARRLNYTCSIYRLVLDPSRQFITKWAKATGCFPKSVPIGAAFNIGERESFISSTAQYTVPFTVNKVEYWDPIILADFNTIAKRYSPGLQSLSEFNSVFNGTKAPPMIKSPTVPESNFTGIPFIDLTPTGLNKLDFYCYKEELANPIDTVLESITSRLESLRR